MYKSKLRITTITLTLLVAIFLGLLVSTEMSTLDKFNQKENNMNIISPDNSGSADYINSPFFNHSAEDFQYYIDALKNGTDGQLSGIYHHSFNNSDGIQLVDANYYSADQFYSMMNWAKSFQNNKLIIISAFSGFQKTPLWDSESSEGGFYHALDINSEPINDEKKVFDNLIALKALFEATGDYTLNVTIDETIEDQWNTIKDLFWDSDNEAFNHSNQDLAERYSADNFLAAINAFQIVKEPQLNSDLRADALATGNAIMDYMNVSTVGIGMYDPNYPSFYNTSFSSTNERKTGVLEKYLLPNALGISALLEWNIANGYDKNSGKINQSEDIWRFLYNNVYNTTHNLYISGVTEPGINPAPNAGHMDLLENSWMLRATLDLYKSTGNITYYKAALEHFYGIENSYYDSINLGYNTTITTESKSLDLKSYDSYNMLIVTLFDFFEIYNSTVATIFVNQTKYLPLIDNQFNATVNYNISMKFDYSETISSCSWEISSIIDNAEIEYTLRYNDNNTIIDDILDVTDNQGNNTYLYDIPNNLPVGNYRLSTFCNKSGYGPSYQNTIINYVSGIYVDSIEELEDNLYQGESVSYNVTLFSIRTDNISVSIENSGLFFDLNTKTDIEILNNTVSFAMITVQAKSESDLGLQDLQLTVKNGSLMLDQANFTVEISSAISFNYISYNQKMIDFNPFELEISIKNNRISTDLSVQFEVSGKYFETISSSASNIPGLDEKIEKMVITPKVDNIYGILKFTLNVTRDGKEIFAKEYSITSVPELEVISITHSSKILQSQKPQIVLKIYNNNLTSKEISIVSNGVIVKDSVVLTYGENIISIPIGNSIINPYDVSSKSYIIEVIDDSGIKISSKKISINVELSISNLIFFYIIPIAVPIGLVLYYKNKEIENKKRI